MHEAVLTAESAAAAAAAVCVGSRPTRCLAHPTCLQTSHQVYPASACLPAVAAAAAPQAPEASAAV